jgi:hypothetical protein
MRSLILFSMLCAGAAAAEIPTVELERHGEAWQASYAFAHPVREMRFARTDAKGNRANMWTPLDAGVEIVLADGEEVVRRRDGAEFAEVAFSMAPRYVPLDKDYAPFSPFGDGGLLIHTGRYFACAPRCDDAVSPAWSFVVHAPAGSHVLQGGKIHGRRAEFVERDSGTNIYVGKAKPIETSHVLAVVDDTFPPEARGMLEQTFPRLMDFYAQRLGALHEKPMMFASHDAKHPGGGYGHQGGTLPGQVFIHLYGPQPKQADPVAGAEALRGFFAHEAGHLFQRYEAGQAEADAWLHEGGADAFSLLALQELGLADAAYRRVRIDSALQQCAKGSKNLALRESADKGLFDNYYRCGLLMQLAVDGAARRQSAGSCDLFCVWRAFLWRVEAGADWSAETWFATVDELAGADTGRFLREAAMTAQADPRKFYQRGLAAAGVLEPPPAQ